MKNEFMNSLKNSFFPFIIVGNINDIHICVCKDSLYNDPMFHLVKYKNNFESAIYIYSNRYCVNRQNDYLYLIDNDTKIALNEWMKKRSDLNPFLTNWEIIRYYWNNFNRDFNYEFIAHHGYVDHKKPNYSKLDNYNAIHCIYNRISDTLNMKGIGDVMISSYSYEYEDNKDIEPHFHVDSCKKNVNMTISLLDNKYITNHGFNNYKLNKDQCECLNEYLSSNNKYFNKTNWEVLLSKWETDSNINMLKKYNKPNYSIIKKEK